MASIRIFELPSTGSELFQDSESFLNELTEREMFGIVGGNSAYSYNGDSNSANSVGKNYSNNNNSINNSGNGSIQYYACNMVAVSD